jgi:AcrR family transcriptional regulator
MPATRSRKRSRKRAYHHGDLRRALAEEAVRTIQANGVQSLTLRAVGQKLGVSRTALYRHFRDKTALLKAVATEGFRTLRLQVLGAWELEGHGLKGFDAMGSAYVRFAVEHPSHYRVMFGGFVGDCDDDQELVSEGSAAFAALVDALAELQQDGVVRRDDPLKLAQFIWAVVHGVAMLAIDGQLAQQQASPDELMAFASSRLRTGIAASL